MFAWASRHPIVTWAIAWGMTGIGLQVGDVFSQPRHGPLWVALVVGSIAWGVAGATTLLGRNIRSGLVIWVVAYLAASWLGEILGNWFEHHLVGSFSSAGFAGMLFGWAAGAAAGALVSARLVSPPWRPTRQAIFALAWGFGFLLGGYVGLGAAMILAQAAKGVLGFLGNWQSGWMFGWGLGCAIGGLIASALGMAARRVLRSEPAEAAV